MTASFDVFIYNRYQLQVTGTNVIGILEGHHYGTDKDVVYGIGAHYDTMRTTPGKYSFSVVDHVLILKTCTVVIIFFLSESYMLQLYFHIITYLKEV